MALTLLAVLALVGAATAVPLRGAAAAFKSRPWTSIPSYVKLRGNSSLVHGWVPLRGNTNEVHEVVSKAGLKTGFSQNHQDLVLLKNFFHNRTHGNFIEIGAFDGKTHSNSKLFEDVLGWKGLLIEGQPAANKKLHINRPNAIISNHAVCEHETKVKFLVRPEGQDPTTATGVVGEQSDTYKGTHLAKLSKNGHEVEVPCSPMSSLIHWSGLKRVDLFSIDVEGSELNLLKSMDWKIPVYAILIEFGSANQGKWQQMHEVLEKNGFYWMEKYDMLTLDRLYINPANKNPAWKDTK